MKCGRCSKQAVLHITEVRKGEAQSLHFCDSCGKDYLNHPKVSKAESPEEGADPLALDELDLKQCPNCGIAFKEFRALGRLGCPHDYVVFEEDLLPLLENIHGDTTHVGKIPKRSPNASQLQFQLIKLRNELRLCIEEERYEDAARIRDAIRQMEESQSLAETKPASGDS